MNRAVLLIAIRSAIVSVSYGMHSPIVPVFAREPALADYSQVGILGYGELSSLFVCSLFRRHLARYAQQVVCSPLRHPTKYIFNFSSFYCAINTRNYALQDASGVAHALFWPSCEVLISINSTTERRVRNISIFFSAWILGFMVGPFIGKLVLNVFDYYTLFRLAASYHGGRNCPICIFAFLWLAGCSKRSGGSSKLCRPSYGNGHPPNACGGNTLLCNDVWSSACSVPAHMSDASLSNQGFELMFFVCGISCFVTLLLLVTRISKYGVPALAKAVLTTAAGTIISFSSRSLLSFAASIELFGLSTSIFYPVSLRLVTMNTPSGHLGLKLGFYNTLFGAGWMAGPIAADLPQTRLVQRPLSCVLYPRERDYSSNYNI